MAGLESRSSKNLHNSGKLHAKEEESEDGNFEDRQEERRQSLGRRMSEGRSPEYEQGLVEMSPYFPEGRRVEHKRPEANFEWESIRSPRRSTTPQAEDSRVTEG